MTMQDLFDRAVGGVLKQGAPSVERRTGRCLYRGPHSTCCAAGHLIDDTHYKSHFEGDIVTTFDILDAIEKSIPGLKIGQQERYLIENLQTSHDAAARQNDFVSFFTARVKELALRYQLGWNF